MRHLQKAGPRLGQQALLSEMPHYMHITPHLKTKRPPLITLVYLESTLPRIKSCWVAKFFSKYPVGTSWVSQIKQNKTKCEISLYTQYNTRARSLLKLGSTWLLPPHLSPYFCNALALVLYNLLPSEMLSSGV